MTKYFGEGNPANHKNEQAIEILKDIKNISDEKIFKAKYEELQKIYEEDRPYIGLYFSRMAVISGKILSIGTSHSWFNIYHNIENWHTR